MSFFLFKWIEGLGHWIGGIFKKAQPFLQKEIPAAIEIINGLKNGVNTLNTGPFKEVLTKLAGKGFSDIVDKVQQFLPGLLTDLNLAKGVVNQSDAESIIQATLSAIQQVVPDKRVLYYSGLASLVAYSLIDGKISLDEVQIIVNKAYQDGINLHLFNDAVPAPQTSL